MGFDSGSISCRFFALPSDMPSTQKCVERFAAHAAPPIDTLTKDPIQGWVSHRHLLDRTINADTVLHAGYPYLQLLKAERKIPTALLRAEIRMEQIVELQARGVAFLDWKTRAEIRKNVTDRLLPQMPPTLHGIEVVLDDREHVLYATATTDKQCDALTLEVQSALGIRLTPLGPAEAAFRRAGVDVNSLAPTSLSPECEDSQASGSVGQDFLTWLWFISERRTGGVRLGGGDEFGIMIEGPLVFVLEGEGAHEATLRRGSPMISAEAKTALLAGKKLRRAVVNLARGEELWRGTIDADTFVFRGLRLPKGEAVDRTGRFQERMLALRTFRETFFSAYEMFLAERATPSRWASTRAEIHEWVASRKAKR
jgi:hypothetical protein